MKTPVRCPFFFPIYSWQSVFRQMRNCAMRLTFIGITEQKLHLTYAFLISIGLFVWYHWSSGHYDFVPLKSTMISKKGRFAQKCILSTMSLSNPLIVKGRVPYNSEIILFYQILLEMLIFIFRLIWICLQ